MEEIIKNELERIAIPDLMKKNFFIPDYQRGYRWEKIHIHQLLSDIWDFINKGNGDFYCLQPIVVRKCDPDIIKNYKLISEFDNNIWYEVIDGQQRLTTIRLIIQMHNQTSPLSSINNCFKLFYQTRPELYTIFDGLQITLNSGKLDVAVNKNSIDSFYISDGLKSIIEWFREPGLSYEKRATLQQFPSFFSVFFGEKSTTDNPRQGKSTQVIWYEVMEKTDSQTIFKRLNDTKIPLSNAELIKALFLSQSSVFKVGSEIESMTDDDAKSIAVKHDKEKKQYHIAKQWDTIEHALGNKKLWSFVTNTAVQEYNTKIELLFDLISKKNTKGSENELNKEDDLYTYLYFDRSIRSGDDLWSLWMKIERYFDTINYWFDDRELFHKIGYLICIQGDSVLIDLLDDSLKKNKDQFKSDLNNIITGTVEVDLAKINYTDNYNEIQRLLVLYNIETTRCLENVEFYPFNLHKEKNWSLEHIHAQNSEYLNKDDQKSWYSWLNEHISVIESLLATESFSKNNREELITINNSLKSNRENKKLDFQTFANEFNRVIKFFDKINNEDGKGKSVHLLSNMALLGGIENTVLSNSIFEAKRKTIISMDADGKYIPVCTRYVFLKYHNSKEKDFSTQQLYFWGEKDRVNYLTHIKNMLSEYLSDDVLSPITDNINDIIQKV